MLSTTHNIHTAQSSRKLLPLPASMLQGFDAEQQEAQTHQTSTYWILLGQGELCSTSDNCKAFAHRKY